jgi:formate hydrogenlyase subunit 3/multisubunit Na+/H+ antiporter MnhD subunit
MSTRNRKIVFLGRKARPVLRADNLAAIYVPISNIVGSLISLKPIGLHGLLREWLFYFFFLGVFPRTEMGHDNCGCVKSKKTVLHGHQP